jgi:uncharacterized protein with GYD domain
LEGHRLLFFRSGAVAHWLYFQRREVMDMQTWVILMNLTDQGIKNIKQAGNRIEAGVKLLEAMGGKMLGFYAVLGEYDYVVIGEVPNEETGMSFLLALGSQGNVRTKAMRAFPQKEFVKIVKKLK